VFTGSATICVVAEVSPFAAKDRTFKTVRPNQGTLTGRIGAEPRRPLDDPPTDTETGLRCVRSSFPICNVPASEVNAWGQPQIGSWRSILSVVQARMR